MLQEVINDQDGKRVWHERVVAITPTDSDGVIVWLGSSKEIRRLPKYLREQKRNLTDAFYSTVKEPGSFFNRLRIGRADGGQLAHIPTAEAAYHSWLEAQTSLMDMLAPLKINSILDIAYQENRYGCGNYWVGMAAFPLPEDWYRPDSFWPGWTHLFHTDRYEQALAAFGYVAEDIHTTGHYPQDLKLLTRELATNLGIKITKGIFGLGNEELYWKLPWLSPALTYHPLTGAVLS